MQLLERYKSTTEPSLCALKAQQNRPFVLELTTRDDVVQSAYTSPELKAGETYTLYIDGKKEVEVTLKNGMNTIGNDGGRFTGGYRRGTW